MNFLQWLQVGFLGMTLYTLALAGIADDDTLGGIATLWLVVFIGAVIYGWVF